MKFLKITNNTTDSAMKISIGPLSFDLLMKINFGSLSFDVLRLWVPGTLFIGLCTVMLLAFDPLLLLIDQIAPGAWLGPILGVAWLSLLILYIVLGVLFTRFSARLLRASFGSAELRVQRRMEILSGLPFFVIFWLFVMDIIYCVLYPDTVGGGAAFFSVAGTMGFALITGSYLLLLRFFLRPSTTIAPQENVM